MTDAIRATLLFIIGNLFDLYSFILIIRVVLASVGADYFHPFTQLIVKMSNIVIIPMKKVFHKPVTLQVATIALIILIGSLKFFLISIINAHVPSLPGLVMLAMGDAIKLTLLAFFYAIIIQVVLSWVQPYSPMNRILAQFISPIMTPIQRIIPPIGGIDITPIPALMLLQATSILIVNPLVSAGFKWL